MAQRRLRTEEPPSTWATATKAQEIVEPSRHPGAPTAARLFTGCSRKQGTRDCQGIKILLAICHRGKELLPQLEVFWNLKLSHVSFLLSLFLLSQFPACWASCHLPCAGFFPRSASPTGAFAKLGFCCAWLPPCGGRAEIVSARLNPSHGTIYVRGVCNFLGSVSLQQKFEATDGPVLQPRVISLVTTKI